MKPIIQIAGVRDAAEAQLLIAAGVDWLGIPLRLDVHTPDLTEADAAQILRSLPATITGTLITYLDQASTIIELCTYLGVYQVQLHGPVSLTTLRTLQQQQPRLRVIKSLIVRPDNLSELQTTMQACAPYVAAYITDTYDPTTGASGATGRTHDWDISRYLVTQAKRPVILAGGLTPQNVAAAIAYVQPAGVDVHTGVEDEEGRKDRQRVYAFVQAARAAFKRHADHAG